MKPVDEILDEIEEYLDRSRTLPFSSKISVNKEDLLNWVNEIRLNLPNEILQAKRIVSDHDRIIKTAQNKAGEIEKIAHSQAEKLLMEHEIYRQAQSKGSEIVEEAKKMARDIRINARVYAEEIMSKLETVLKEAMISYQKQDRLVEDCFSQLINALYESKKNLNGEDAN